MGLLSTRVIERAKSPYMGRMHFDLATFTIGAETGGNTKNVAIQLQNANGEDLYSRAGVLAYLSSDAEGDNIISSAPSGGVAIGTDGVAIPLVAGKAFMLISEDDGDIDINIIEAGAATYYLILVMPDGSLLASSVITFV